MPINYETNEGYYDEKGVFHKWVIEQTPQGPMAQYEGVTSPAKPKKPGVPTEPTIPIPQKDETAHEFIKRREKYASQLSVAEGRGGGVPSKRSMEEATRLALEETAQMQPQITTTEAQQVGAEKAQMEAGFKKLKVPEEELSALDKIPGIGALTSLPEEEKSMIVNTLATTLTMGTIILLTRNIGASSTSTRGIGSNIKSIIFGGAGGYGISKLTSQGNKIISDASQEIGKWNGYYDDLITQTKAGLSPEQAYDKAIELEQNLINIEAHMKILTTNWFPAFNNADGRMLLTDIENMKRNWQIKRQLLIENIALARRERIPE